MLGRVRTASFSGTIITMEGAQGSAPSSSSSSYYPFFLKVIPLAAH